jgi:hypothetical protein
MTPIFLSLDPSFVAAVRAGGPDANGQPAERAISDGVGTPCRCCLGNVPEGEEMLILAARPFPELQPYAETGPVFLCAGDCVPWSGPSVPPVLSTSPDYLLKGYLSDHRIVYGTGRVTPFGGLLAYSEALLNRDDVAFVDVRSSRNNCWLARAVAME